MPYGSPAGPTDTGYTLIIRSVEQADGYPVTFTVSAATEVMGNPVVAKVVESFAAVVDASPAFTLVSGTRRTVYAESLSLTEGVA